MKKRSRIRIPYPEAFCEAHSKFLFASRKIAKRAMENSGKDANGLNIYACTEYNGFHFGHDPRMVARPEIWKYVGRKKPS